MRIGIPVPCLLRQPACGWRAAAPENSPTPSKQKRTARTLSPRRRRPTAAPPNSWRRRSGSPAAAEPGLYGSDPNDALNLGKTQYRANNFGLAEKYFRHAVELHPRDAEAWLGLAASYDRLRRFDLADRAYGQAIRIVGPTAEILNNQGYSYMLRGDYKHAREKLGEARRRDPGNKYVLNNIQLLQDSYRTGKAIE